MVMSLAAWFSIRTRKLTGTAGSDSCGDTVNVAVRSSGLAFAAVPISARSRNRIEFVLRMTFSIDLLWLGNRIECSADFRIFTVVGADVVESDEAVFQLRPTLLDIRL